MKLRYKKYIKYIFIIIMAGLLFYYFDLAKKRSIIHAAYIGGISQSFESYIKENKEFPLSESDLINKGYLIREKDRYSWLKIPNDPKSKISDLEWFKVFNFKYGFRHEEVELKNGKLIDKTTGEQVLLISGPDYWDLHVFYESISSKWYLILKDTPK